MKSLINNKLPISLMDWMFLVSTSITFLIEIITRIFALIVAIVYRTKNQKISSCIRIYFQIFYFIGINFDVSLILSLFMLYKIDQKPDFRKFVQEIIATWTIFVALVMLLCIGSSVTFFKIIDDETTVDYSFQQNKKYYSLNSENT